MRLRRVHQVALFFAAFLTACGGGGGTTTAPNPPSAAGTTMSVTFLGTNQPLAVAVAIGTGAFTQATLTGGQLTFVLPTGTSTYQLAYHCPTFPALGLADDEYIIAANKSDGTSFSVTCYAPVAGTNVSATVNASAIAGAAATAFWGIGDYGGSGTSANGSATGSLLSGTNDLAFTALDGSNNILAVKFVRGQMIPGTINGGNPVVFAASDAVTSSTMTVAGIPSGFSPTPAYNISYQTASGTSFGLNRNTSSFPVVPTANMAAGDTYVFETNDNDSVTGQTVGATAYATTGAPITVTLPPPWTYSGPTAAAYPTFTFAYTGFTTGVVTYSGAEFWTENATTEAGITVLATPAYLGGTTTVAIPNLSTLTGFLAHPASGTMISVVSEVNQGASLLYEYHQQSTGPAGYVQFDSSYTEP